MILEGESLFNDAGALLDLPLSRSAWRSPVRCPQPAPIPWLFVVTLGERGVGALARDGVVVPSPSRGLHDVGHRGRRPVLRHVRGLDACGAPAPLREFSPMVVFAMTTARFAADLVPCALAHPSYAVWVFAVFVLNVLAFILVGLQLKAIVVRLDSPTRIAYAGIGAAVVLRRSSRASFGFRPRRRFVDGTVAGRRAVRWARTIRAPSRGARGGRSWCGMRGIVTLAAALAIPTTRSDGSAFPCRDLVLFTAFSVVLGTLVLQGMTLRPLMNSPFTSKTTEWWSGEVRLARVERLRAALSTALALPEDEISALMRHRYQLMLRRAEADFAESERGHLQDASGHHVMLSDSANILRAAMTAERRRLLALRPDGHIGDAAFQRIEQELDFEELYLQQLAPDDESRG